jgi:hypothetical protein
VFGLAVLTSVFANSGGYRSDATFVHGMRPALWIGAALVGVAAASALAIPRTREQKAELKDLASAMDAA